jgi:hypothetical protein
VHPLSYFLTKPDEPDDSRSIQHKLEACCRRVVYLEPDDALDNPDEGPSFSSGEGVGLSGGLDKPDAASCLKDRIGKGLLALCVGFVGLG